MFQANGVVAINRRPAANVLVSFTLSVPGRPPQAARLEPRRRVPPPVHTDKLGRWVQDGFLDGVEYVATVSAPGITFTPARAPLDTDHQQLLAESTTGTFAASGVARVPALLNEPGKPPGIPGVQ